VASVEGQSGGVGDGEGDGFGLPAGDRTLPGSIDHLRGKVDRVDRPPRTGGGDPQGQEAGPGPGVKDPRPRGERGIEQVGGHPRVQAPGETAGPSFVKLAVSGETEHRGMRVMDGRHEILLVQLWNTTLKEGVTSTVA